MQKEVNITLRVSAELHKDIKICATQESKTIKDYILDLVLKDLSERKQK